MAFTIVDPQLGQLAIANIDAGILPPSAISSGSTTTIPTPPLRPGMIVLAQDPVLGDGEFILLAGVGSTTVGSPVVYNSPSFTTALAPVGTNLPQPIAFAMSANTSATAWGWYQIGGLAVAAKGSVSLLSNTAIGIQTIGLVNASFTGMEVEGALVAALATITATTVQLLINRPHMQGRIT